LSFSRAVQAASTVATLTVLGMGQRLAIKVALHGFPHLLLQDAALGANGASRPLALAAGAGALLSEPDPDQVLAGEA